MNLPNWSTNPHLRRVLQRMQNDYTSIFGGRDRELDELDGWLADEDRPFALLLAPTGRGKTALVWHWLTRQQHKWQVIFVPVSIRYGNSSQADVFAALTHAFAHMHDELDDFNALQHSANELRPKLAAYLRRDLPADTRVLLAIDGLDEATGWELGADLLPDNPPANLKILLSARDMAQHQRADWYRKLGLPADRTQDFTLGGLDRIALKELLIALGTPLDELAADFDVLGELLRVSAGDPVIVRLLVQLLREERIQIGQLTQLPQDDLNAVFALWLNQLNAQQSQLAQILLLLFANAYGPLSARDLLGLAPDHFADADQITQAIAPLARFVIGDAESGYIFSHQKLRELYRERLDAQTLAEWNARFVNYGKKAHQDPTPYLCRFLVNHLRDAGEWQFIRDLLADFSPQQAWADARYALEGNYNGYLRDLEVLQTWAEQHDLALSIHCSLISSSIRSISQNVRGDLLVHLITIGTTKGKWSVEAALAHIEQQALSAIESLTTLIKAGIPIPWEPALEIVENGTHYDEEVPYFYTVLYPLVPADFQANILQKLAASLTADSFDDNIDILTEFLAQLPEQSQNYFWQQFSTININYPISTLSDVLDRIPEPWQSQLYQQHFVPALSKLIPQQLHESQYRHLLLLFKYLPNEQQSLRYWGVPFSIIHQQELQILHLLPESELHELAKELLQTQSKPKSLSYNRLGNLLALYPQEPALLTLAFNFSLERPDYLHSYIEKLPEHLYYPLTERLLANANSIPKHQQLYRTLIRLLPYVPQLKQQIIDYLLAIIPSLESYLQVATYCDLIPHLAETQQTTIVEQAWHSSHIIDDIAIRIGLQADLFQHLNQAQQKSVGDTLIQLAFQHHLFSSIRQLATNIPNLHTQIYQYLLPKTTLTRGKNDLFLALPTNLQQDLTNRHYQKFLQDHIYRGTDFYDYFNQTQLQQITEIILQDDNPQNWPSIFSKLIRMPNYPSMQLLPHIIRLPERSERVSLLIDLLNHTAPDQHPAIKQALEPDLSEIISETAELIDQYIASKHSQPHHPTWQQESQIEHNLNLFLELPSDIQAAEQMHEQLSRYLHELSRTVDTLVKNHFTFNHSVSRFNQQQIQAVLEYMASHEYRFNVIKSLVPHLNPEQLQQLLQIIHNSNDTNLITTFYTSAQQHHNIFQQQSYYQHMLHWLQQDQFKHKDWDWIEVINELAPYLDAKYYQIQLHTTLKRLETIYLSPDDYYYINRAVEKIVEKQLYDQQTFQYFIIYAARQPRNKNFEILGAILPAYLETLAPEQAQQLASQINQSIEQITTCWP